jgi:hypothetical protein
LRTLTNGILENRCSQCSIRHGVQPGFQSVDPNKYLELSEPVSRLDSTTTASCSAFLEPWPKRTSSFDEPLEIHLELPQQPDQTN